MHRTILVGATPGEAGRDALALGVELARPFGAQVVLAGVAAHRDGRPHDEHELDELLRELQALCEGAPSDVPVAVEAVAAKSVLRGLHDLATKHEAGVLVLGHGHRGTIGRALHGDTAADAVFTAACAIAVAAPGQATRTPRTVGVAWNATPEADEALEWAVQLAERSGATLEIIRVLEARHAEGTKPEPAAGEEVLRARAAAEQRVRCEARLAWGDPPNVLREAGRHLDVLVLGSRAQAPVRRALFGSVSSDVVHDAHCAIVVLPRGVHAPMDTAAV